MSVVDGSRGGQVAESPNKCGASSHTRPQQAELSLLYTSSLRRPRPSTCIKDRCVFHCICACESNCSPRSRKWVSARRVFLSLFFLLFCFFAFLLFAFFSCSRRCAASVAGKGRSVYLYHKLINRSRVQSNSKPHSGSTRTSIVSHEMRCCLFCVGV